LSGRCLPGRSTWSPTATGLRSNAGAPLTLVLLPEEEYPSLPEMPPFVGSVGSDAMASAISQVAIAAGRMTPCPR